MTNSITIPLIDDLHIHLRDDEMMNFVTPLISKGGSDRVLVMPNLTPPITNVQMAIDYHQRLDQVNPKVTYLMTLYLHHSLTPEMIVEAKKSSIITGVKSYPQGVTTNSGESGLSSLEDYARYYPVFEEMERQGLILHLHGEVPSSEGSDICVMNAEEAFLDQLLKLHQRFPRLKIILEHATTAAAIKTVTEQCGDTVACTITAHHLYLTVDDWPQCPHNYCKPVAKFPHDRQALRNIIKQGHPRCFLGSDSAPHPIEKKNFASSGTVAAGVFTSPFLIVYLAHIFEQEGMLDRLAPFASEFGAKFYGLSDSKKKETITLERRKFTIPGELQSPEGKIKIVPFLAGKTLDWSIK